ncbi:trypsin-like peptidase domain-containing protein [Streptomyces sp. MBT62]|uniref:trypsin-like peptidase domain-containing protein n=1 Tax=Streptomyces sp. MBT62 TaxID=2800410 RepID=UPI001909119D|nr:trypsin-like peptidase domain-containing protein [Streptomyces sp. MBT62]MBK3563708.1 trypsin-like peptidase domain-containing protein [Streptomyces sp. MBT62]
MPSAVSIPRAERVVEVIADLGADASPRYRYGSGCIVRGSVVVTAGHVVQAASRVLVRDVRKRVVEAKVDPRLVVVTDTLDLALITVDGPWGDLPPIRLALIDRDSAVGEPVRECQVVGYPAFMERPRTGRDTAAAYGRVAVLASLVSGLLTVQVSSSPRPLPPEQRPLCGTEWSGVSGAPVFVDEYLIGVVSEHAPRQGSSSITAVPFALLAPDPSRPLWGDGVPDAAVWWDLLGVTDPGELPRLPNRRDRREPAHRATVREVHARTPQLLGRQSELAEIDAFVSGPAGYRWLTGEMWSGKTALLAEAVVAAVPERTDVVAYFLSRCEADAHSSRFLAAVVPQLSYLLAEDPPDVASVEQFRDLWHRSALRAARIGRHLLLVVDGLDEDIRPPNQPSVAHLLPVTRTPQGHVLVSSRSGVPLPDDVSPSHPLRSAEAVALRAAVEAQSLSALALAELDTLTHSTDDNVARDVLSLLAAAAGPLTVEDLVTLCSTEGASIEQLTGRITSFVTEHAVRSLRQVGHGSNSSYQFAHESLLAAAQLTAAPRLPVLRRRLERWAATWKEAGWPLADQAGSPSYLFHTYPTTLRGDTARLRTLFEDIGWIVAAVRTIGIDQTLAHIALAGPLRPRDRLSMLRAALRSQTQYLRAEFLWPGAGSVLRQLCLGALELGAEDIAQESRELLRAQPCPWPIPLWTNRRNTPAFTIHLGSHQEWVQGIAELPDGRVVSVGDDAEIMAWDRMNPGTPGVRIGRHDSEVVSSTGTSFGEPLRHVLNRGVLSVVSLEDGRLVTGGGDGMVRLWHPGDPASDGITLGRHTSEVVGLELLPGGRIISMGCFRDGRIAERARVWNPAQPDQAEAEFGPADARMGRIAVLPEGQIVSGHPHGALLLWSPTSGASQPTVFGQLDSDMVSLAVLDDGRVAVGEKYGTITIWDPAAPGVAVRLGHASHRHPFVAGLRNDRLVSGARDGRLLIWDVRHPDAPPALLGRHDAPISALAVLRDGTVVSGGMDGRVLIWDPQDAMPEGIDLNSHRERDVAVLPDGRVVSLGDDGRPRLWDPTASRPVPVEVGNYGPSTIAQTVLPDGSVLGEENGMYATITPSSRAADNPGEEDFRRQFHAWRDEIARAQDDAFVQSMAVLPSGNLLLGGFDGVLRLRDPDRPHAPAVVVGRHPGPVEAIAVADEGSVVTGCYDGVVRRWDLGTLLRRRRGLARLMPGANRSVEQIVGRADDRIVDVLVLPDGRVAWTWRDGSAVRIGHPDRPEERYELPDSYGIWSLATDIDNAVIGVNGAVRVWRLDTTSYEPSQPVPQRVNAAAGAGSGLLVIGGPGHLALWDAALGVGIATSGHLVRSLSLGPSLSHGERLLATTHPGHGVTVWAVAVGEPDFWNKARSDPAYRAAILSESTRSYFDGQYSRAEELLQHLLDIDPHNAAATTSMAFLRLVIHADSVTSGRLLRTVVESNPDQGRRYSLLGLHSLAIGDRQAAREYYERSVKYCPTAEAETQLGALSGGPDDEGARRHFRRALTLVDEQSQSSLFRRAETRARALLGLGHGAEAVSNLAYALSQPDVEAFLPCLYAVFDHPQRADALSDIYQTWRDAITARPTLAGAWGGPPRSVS